MSQNCFFLTRRSRSQESCGYAAIFQHSAISFQLQNKKRRVHSPSTKYCVHFGANFTSKRLFRVLVMQDYSKWSAPAESLTLYLSRWTILISAFKEYRPNR